MTDTPNRRARRPAPRSVPNRPAAQPQAADLLSLAVAQSPTVFYVASLDGAQPIRFISPNIERLTGHPAEAFLGDPGYGRRFIHPEDIEGYRHQLARLPEQGSCAQEYRFRCADGRYLWFRDRMTLADGAAGESVSFIGCMIDVTAEKRDRDVLQDAVDSLQSAFATSGRDGRLVLCNRAFAEDFGSTPEDLIGG